MVHGQSFSLDDIQVFEQMLVLLKEMKGLANKLQADYKFLKQTLKEYFEDIHDEDVEARIQE